MLRRCAGCQKVAKLSEHVRNRDSMVWSEPMEHEVDHGGVDEALACFLEPFVVLGEAAVLAEPGEGAPGESVLAKLPRPSSYLLVLR